MRDSNNIDIDELGEEFARDLNRSRENTSFRRKRRPARFQPERSTLVFAAIGVVFLIFILTFLFRDKEKVTLADITTIRTKMEEVEKRLAAIEGLERKVAGLENKIKGLERSQSRLKSPPTANAKQTTKANRYHVVKRGETLSGIAKKYGMTLRELSRLNHITLKTIIRPGQRLLVAPGT